MPDPWQHWPATTIAAATGAPLANVEASWPLIHAALTERNISDRPVLAAAASTIAIETASRFLPIHEFRNADGSIPAVWYTYDGGPEYHGRGFIQLTHRSNYRKYGDLLGIDLVGNPDRALEPSIAADILALYFANHGGGPLIPQAARRGDWREVRRLVQGGTAGLDRLLAIVAALEVAPMPITLSEVLARGRSRIGDPYVWDGEQPGGFDCSGFVKWCYGGALTSFTDAILGETQRVEKPAPGDIVLYEYRDSSQPGVRFPHVGLFLSDTRTLDARFGAGVGEHDQLARSTATRYYRRLADVVVDTDGTAPAPPAPPAPSPQETIDGLRTAVAHLADVVVPKAAEGARIREEALAEARQIREQFVGVRPV